MVPGLIDTPLPRHEEQNARALRLEQILENKSPSLPECCEGEAGLTGHGSPRLGERTCVSSGPMDEQG